MLQIIKNIKKTQKTNTLKLCNLNFNFKQFGLIFFFFCFGKSDLRLPFLGIYFQKLDPWTEIEYLIVFRKLFFRQKLLSEKFFGYL